MKKRVFLTLITLAWLSLAFRMPHPQVFTHPLTKSQINQLNETMEDIWNLQNGRFQLDIVTTSKSGAKNGEIWIFNDSGTFKLEIKANDTVHTFSPD